MKLTTNYGLKKPEGSDVVNIDDFNYNTDVLDNAIKEVKTKVDNLNLTASNVKMADGSNVEEAITNLQTELNGQKTRLINACNTITNLM